MALAERPRADHRVPQATTPSPELGVSAQSLFADGVNPAVRDALYQWYEQRGLTVDVFGPFAFEAVAYARRVAGIRTGDGHMTADEAYQCGRCVECATVPYSPGMLRCEQCHRRCINRRGER